MKKTSENPKRVSLSGDSYAINCERVLRVVWKHANKSYQPNGTNGSSNRLEHKSIDTICKVVRVGVSACRYHKTGDERVYSLLMSTRM